MNIPNTQRAEIEALLGVNNSRMRRVFSLRNFFILLVVAAAAYAGWRYYGTVNAPRLAYTFVTELATKTELIVRITATGTVQPTNKVDISSELSGVVRIVNVDYNSFVRKGDILAELDMTKLTATVESSRARLSASRAAVQDAKVFLEEKRVVYSRTTKLTASDSISAQTHDTAKAAYDRALVAIETATANVDMSLAQLRLDETNLARARISSPIDGVILVRNVDPGQTVASSLQAPILFTIAEDLKRMEILVDVDEADVGTVREAQKATFVVDAYPNKTFDAEIRMLRFGSEVVQGVVTYKAVLTTDNSDLLLRPGMTATAEIVVEQLKDALTVPNQALRFQPPQIQAPVQKRSLLDRLLPSSRPQFRPPSQQPAGGASARIFVLRDGQPLPVRVVVGPSDGQRTQIVSGDLQVGDAVIVDTAQRR